MPRKRREIAKGLSSAGKAMSRIAAMIRQQRQDAKDDAARQRQLDMAEERLNIAQQQLDMAKNKADQDEIMFNLNKQMAEFQLGELPKEAARAEESHDFNMETGRAAEGRAAESHDVGLAATKAGTESTLLGNEQKRMELEGLQMNKNVFDMQADLEDRIVGNFLGYGAGSSMMSYGRYDERDLANIPEETQQLVLQKRGLVSVPREPKGQITPEMMFKEIAYQTTNSDLRRSERPSVGDAARNVADMASYATFGRPMLTPEEQQHRQWIEEAIKSGGSTFTVDRAREMMAAQQLTEEQIERILDGLY